MTLIKSKRAKMNKLTVKAFDFIVWRATNLAEKDLNRGVVE
mgnify:CR=1 FL=1